MILLCIWGVVVYQLSWNAPGVSGPVSNWYRSFHRSQGLVDVHLGQLCLSATSWDYNSWISHTVEGSGMSYGAQGVLPADVDGDGDVDLVAPRGDYAVWYENTGSWNYTRHTIGNAPTDGDYSCTCPGDLDGDGDVDVAVATNQLGIGWYEQTGGSWIWHLLEARDNNNDGFHCVRAFDFDQDGDLDLLAVDNSYPSGNAQDDESFGDIVLFRNQGGGAFASRQVLWNFSSTTPRAFNAEPVDLNGDEYPDIATTGPVMVLFINNNGVDVDSVFAGHCGSLYGIGEGDVDANGWVDVGGGGRIGTSEIWQNAALNQGNTSFMWDSLNGTHSTGSFDGYDYQYGGRFGDLDMDGMQDDAATGYRTTWYRQSSAMSFTKMNDLGSQIASDWVYLHDMDQGCTPDLDMIVVRGALFGGGSIVIYENRIAQSFVSDGWLESSVLDMNPGSPDGGRPLWFGYNACVPSGASIEFYFRHGLTIDACTTATWQGPFSAVSGIDSIDISGMVNCSKFFQYRVEMTRGMSESPVLRGAWLRYSLCTLNIGVRETGAASEPTVYQQGKDLVLNLPAQADVDIKIYSTDGRRALSLSEEMGPGTHRVCLNRTSGVYVIFLRVGSWVKRLKAVVK